MNFSSIQERLNAVFRETRQEDGELSHKRGALTNMSKTNIQQTGIRVEDVINSLVFLDPNPPLTVEYSKTHGDRGIVISGYKSQKDCMYYMLNEQFRNAPGLDAAYDRLVNPFGLLWLVETLGEELNVLRASVESALASENDSAKKICNAFREVIPYERIKQLIDNPRGWHYDQSLEMFMEFKKRSGLPVIAKGCMDDFKRAINKEGIYYDICLTEPLSPPVRRSAVSSIKRRLEVGNTDTDKKGSSSKNKADIHVQDMFYFMSYLQPHPPINNKLDCWGSRYPSQKGHMLGWFESQPIGTNQKAKAFAYERQTGNESSRTAYNRFLNPGGLLWMAEAFGENEDTLRKAVVASVEAEKINYRSRCSAFRKVIPFDRIVELLTHPEGWLYDPSILPMLEFDPQSGLPVLKKEFEGNGEYDRMVNRELDYFGRSH